MLSSVFLEFPVSCLFCFLKSSRLFIVAETFFSVKHLKVTQYFLFVDSTHTLKYTVYYIQQVFLWICNLYLVSPQFLLPCHLTQPTQWTARHDHPVITHRATNAISAANTCPQSDHGAWKKGNAAAVPIVLSHLATQDTRDEGSTQTDATVFTAVTHIGIPF